MWKAESKDVGGTVKKRRNILPSSCDAGVTELPAPELEILCQISKVALRVEGQNFERS